MVVIQKIKLNFRKLLFWLSGGAAATIIAAIIQSNLIKWDKRMDEFELQSCFHPDSLITIKLRDCGSTKNKELIVRIDDYLIQSKFVIKKKRHWEFYPNSCFHKKILSKVLSESNEHTVSLRLVGFDKVKVRTYPIYFDSTPASLALQKTFKGTSLALKGRTTEDSVHVYLSLWNGVKYESTELPLHRQYNDSGQVFLTFKANVKGIPKLNKNDPDYIRPYCRIQVRDRAKNLTSHEIPYSQLIAEGTSKSVVGDANILMDVRNSSVELKPIHHSLNIDAPEMIMPTPIVKDFRLVIYVYKTGHACIGVKNLPPDAQGLISYHKNKQLLKETSDTTIVDRNVKAGDFHEYQATVKGKGGKIHKTNHAFSLESEMVFVEGETFKMGSDEYNEREKPVHDVTLDSYHISKYEVTQVQWKKVMGNNPSMFKGDHLPVERVSWDDCQEFIKKLNRLTGKKYRLPTEAEWEYAARGGNRSQGYIYSGSDNIDEVTWYWKNSGDKYLQGDWSRSVIEKNHNKTKSVGGKKPNELGIYDMSGNVWEWCQDWYDKNSPKKNPQGPNSGSDRVIRGGSWRTDAQYCRSANRGGDRPDFRRDTIGFRLVFVPQSVGSSSNFPYEQKRIVRTE